MTPQLASTLHILPLTASPPVTRLLTYHRMASNPGGRILQIPFGSFLLVLTVPHLTPASSKYGDQWGISVGVMRLPLGPFFGASSATVGFRPQGVIGPVPFSGSYAPRASQVHRTHTPPRPMGLLTQPRVTGHCPRNCSLVRQLRHIRNRGSAKHTTVMYAPFD